MNAKRLVLTLCILALARGAYGDITPPTKTHPPTETKTPPAHTATPTPELTKEPTWTPVSTPTPSATSSATPTYSYAVAVCDGQCYANIQVHASVNGHSRGLAVTVAVPHFHAYTSVDAECDADSVANAIRAAFAKPHAARPPG